jgi:hypothetical protein
VACIETESAHKMFDRIFSSEEQDLDRKTILEWIYEKQGEVDDQELPDVSFLGTNWWKQTQKTLFRWKQ